MLVKLTQESIDEIFSTADDQADYIISLYRYVYPNWDDIEKIDGWPRVSDATNEYIFNLAIKFDSKRHPGVMPGGAWMNNGFSCSSDDSEPSVPNWHVRPAPVIVKAPANTPMIRKDE